MKAIPKTEYQRCFADWKKRWLKCIVVNGDLFEGDNLNLDIGTKVYSAQRVVCTAASERTSRNKEQTNPHCGERLLNPKRDPVYRNKRQVLAGGLFQLDLELGTIATSWDLNNSWTCQSQDLATIFLITQISPMFTM
ncbi:hypothetical protein LAZ67_20001468 [Cordylochernes scorpioides]|uniref:Uncharacterized protein n=1 Tax=Cordylochernes scorpioides TaxID=51811 RepID=A0ABY6LKY9_9ARAC|nr:hypothetical protein LAZ67_20001468 [Cordylochernes scorpioides]